jgi:hypothetical protein
MYSIFRVYVFVLLHLFGEAMGAVIIIGFANLIGTKFTLVESIKINPMSLNIETIYDGAQRLPKN